MYNIAYPLGYRLGVTYFWPHAAMQQRFFSVIARGNIVMTQWLVFWFYAQRIYFTAIEIIDAGTRIDYLHLNFSYFFIPRNLWKKKRRKSIRKKRRRRKIRRFWKRRRFLTKLKQKSGIHKKKFSKSALSLLNKFSSYFWPAWRRTAQLAPLFYRSSDSGLATKYGSLLLNSTNWVAQKHFHLLKRVVTGFYKFSQGPNYIQYEESKLKKTFFYTAKKARKKRNTFFSVQVTRRCNKSFYEQSWLRRAVYRRRKFFMKQLYTPYRRIGLQFNAKITHIRLLWYIKICFDRYFNQNCLLHGTNLYSYYFQPSPITRLRVRSRRSLANYLRYKSTFRQKQTLSLQAQRPRVINKFTYTQLVLFLGLQPKWRKFVNAYVLCYLVIISAILKNVQVLAQWLYTIIIHGRTRRLRQMRMQFFSLVSVLLRNFGVFGQYLRGFRIEVLGKTSRSQKTRTRILGDTEGLRFFNLSFRINYSAFEIPTFAGLLGVKFWIY